MSHLEFVRSIHPNCYAAHLGGTARWYIGSAVAGSIIAIETTEAEAWEQAAEYLSKQTLPEHLAGHNLTPDTTEEMHKCQS